MDYGEKSTIETLEQELEFRLIKHANAEDILESEHSLHEAGGSLEEFYLSDELNTLLIELRFSQVGNFDYPERCLERFSDDTIWSIIQVARENDAAELAWLESHSLTT